MNSGVHHPHYRVTRSAIPGFWTGTCKVCEPARPIKSHPSASQAEASVREHLADDHAIKKENP